MRAADAGGILQHSSEHRLQLAGRRADDAKHLACGFFSLQRLVALTGELSNVRLRFVVGSGWIALTSPTAPLLYYGLAPIRFSSLGCFGAPSHCLVLAQHGASYWSGLYCAPQQNWRPDFRSDHQRRIPLPASCLLWPTADV
jgi:hypothetical protein